MFKLNKVKISDIIITTILSVIITVKAYSFLYPVCHYKNLKDFYVGMSIYLDHNKSLDIWIYFLYLALFFLIFPVVHILNDKLFKQKIEKSQEIEKNENINPLFLKLKNICIRFQYIGVLGFIFIHPFDGNFYIKPALIILILILISIYDVYKRTENSENKSFSPFVITAVLFFLTFYSSNTGLAPADNHHFGEKFAVFFMHNNFNLAFYKDIILVHGLKDILSSWFGANIFNQNNLYGYCLGEIFFQNINLIFLYITSLFIFKKEPVFVALLLLFKTPPLSMLYICIYLLLIKKSVINKPYLCLTLYILLSFVFISIWTTIGSFWSVACLPFAIYSFKNILKPANKKNTALLIIPVFTLFLIIIFYHNAIFEYLKITPEYIKANLIVFGNNFDNNILSVSTCIDYISKMFVLIFLPVIIIQFIIEISKQEKDVQSILFLSFALIFPFLGLSYILGRIDNLLMGRLSYFSMAYIAVILPFFLCKYCRNKSKIRILFKILTIIIICLQLINLPSKIKTLYYENTNQKTGLYNTGNISLEYNENKRINDIKDFVYNKNSDSALFFDLTNSGMLYLYLNKKIPVPFISFYNAVTTKQSNLIAEKLSQNLPDIILIKSKFNNFDMAFPSLRVNSMYKMLLYSKKYKLEEYKGNVFLVKSNNENKFSEENLRMLDSILSISNLKFLPEVWANSVKTLPMKKRKPEFYSYTLNDEIIIKFNNNQSLKNFDLLYLEDYKGGFYTISINDSESEITCKSKSGKILVPLDNYPSWLLNENIKEIKIRVNGADSQKAKIEFYQRNIS